MQVALAQMCSGRDVDANLDQCRRMADRAAERGARWLLFPENAPFLGADAEKLEVAEALDGPIVSHFRRLADTRDLWVTVGSVPETGPDDERTYNTQLLVDPDGAIQSVYRKLHLFDVDLEGGRQYRESDHVAGGDELVVTALADREDPDATLQVGLSICYDLRFPEMYRHLVSRGAEVLTVPSAFTLQTGRDHWHPLLQARAIENQCWVLAPNQWGHHFGDRASYGHSAVYDPWGRRVACASDREELVFAELDRDYTREVRRSMPVADHIRVGVETDPSPPGEAGQQS